MTRHPAPRVALSCLKCGLGFERLASQVKSPRVYCSTVCYGQARRKLQIGGGVPRRITPEGTKIVSSGYTLVFQDGRYRPEHRLVMERELGRSLLPGENVHHKNGFRSDNRPENLELWVSHQPSGQRVEDML